jgi:hypothetical protein
LFCIIYSCAEINYGLCVSLPHSSGLKYAKKLGREGEGEEGIENPPEIWD